jgi:hypothetical protein
MQRAETNKKFLQYAGEISIDWDAIKTKIALESENEMKRPGAKPLA